MYDSDLSMPLSQHLFNLQLGVFDYVSLSYLAFQLQEIKIARHLYHRTEGNLTMGDVPASAEPNESPRVLIGSALDAESTVLPEADHTEPISGHEDGPDVQASGNDVPDLLSGATAFSGVAGIIEQLKVNQG